MPANTNIKQSNIQECPRTEILGHGALPYIISYSLTESPEMSCRAESAFYLTR